MDFNFSIRYPKNQILRQLYNPYTGKEIPDET